MKQILLLLLFLMISCQGPKTVDTATVAEVPHMRHGTVFQPPKRTQVGVNDVDSINRGKAIYDKNCKSCHGLGAEGDGPVGKAIQSKPANLKKLSKILPNHHFFMQINRGPGEMPAWEDVLSDREVWDLTNYIQTLGRGK